MLDINEVGNVPTQTEKQTIFTGRKIDSVGVIEGIEVNINYTDCSNDGDMSKTITLPFEQFQSDLEPIINQLIDERTQDNDNRN